jgi:hypothetical protein
MVALARCRRSGGAVCGGDNYLVVVSSTSPNYTGSISGNLIVKKAVGTISLSGLTQPFDGTAKSAGTATAPAGLAVNVSYNGTANVPISPGNYAVVAAIIDPNYTGSASGTLTILPDFASYLSQYLTGAQVANPAVSGPTANPAGDGMPNLLKYAFSLDPTQVDTLAGNPVVGQSTGGLTITYIQRHDISDITYTVQVSTDLVSCSSGPTFTQQISSTPLDATRNIVVVGALTPVGSVPAQFIRLSVTQP